MRVTPRDCEKIHIYIRLYYIKLFYEFYHDAYISIFLEIYDERSPTSSVTLPFDIKNKIKRNRI